MSRAPAEGRTQPYVAGTANNGLWHSAAARRVTLGLPDMPDSGSQGQVIAPAAQSRALCEELVRAPEPSILENHRFGRHR
jgi:hypothetical protein